MANIKKSLISCFSGLAALCLSVGLGLNTATAGAEEMFALPETVTGTATEAVEGVVEISSFTISEKASVRVKSPNGIRFETGISSADLAKLPSNATFGTLIIPTRVLNGAELNLDAVTTLDAVNVVANVWREHSTATTLVYSGVLGGESENGSFQDYPEAFYNEEISARGYVSYTDANGETQVIYTTDTAKRSLAYVAGAALQGAYGKAEGEDGYLSDTSKTFLKKVVDTVVTSVSFTQNDEAVTELAMETRETVDLVLVGAQGIPAIITTTGGITVDENLTVKAVSAGEATLTATVGNRTATVTFNVTQCVKDKIAAALKNNQIALFNTADYAQLFSKATVSKYNTDTATAMVFNTANNCYGHSSVAWNGTAFKIDFPVEKTYTDGYLAITLWFGSENQAFNNKVHVFNYDDTDGTSITTFANFAQQVQKIYVPMSKLVDENNVLKGMQIAWSGWGGGVYMNDVTYSPNMYSIVETMSTTELIVGNEYDVTYGAAENGIAIDGATVSLEIADTSVLTIVDGKLTALKAGTTRILMKYNNADISSWISAAAKYFNVTVQKSYFEQIADTLDENEIAMFDNPLYLHTLSALTINKYNGVEDSGYEPKMVTGDTLMKYVPAWGGSGRTITFVKQNTYTSGYLKLRVHFDRAATNGRVLNFYKYGETDSTKYVKTLKDEIANSGSIYVYIPMTDLVNENGILEGIQFTSYYPSGWTYIGEMTYVAELPTA